MSKISFAYKYAAKYPVRRVVLSYRKQMFGKYGELKYAKQVYSNGKARDFTFTERVFIFVVQMIAAQYHRKALIANIRYEKLFHIKNNVELYARNRFYSKRDEVKNSM